MVVDVLSASGLRAIRYAKEISDLKVILELNDFFLFYFETSKIIIKIC